MNDSHETRSQYTCSPEVVYAHDLIPAGIDDFDGDAPMFAGWERQGGGAAEVFETLRGDDALQGAGNFAPGFLVWKEGLGDAEGSAVVVGINEPRRHPVATFGGHHVVDGIVDIDALHRDDVLVVFRHFNFCTRLAEHGEELTGGSLFEQAAHCHVGVDVRHVGADSGIRIVTDSGLGGAVKTETRKDQIVVAAAEMQSAGTPQPASPSPDRVEARILRQ